MHLDAIALAELRGGGAELVARDAAAGADLVLKKLDGARGKGQIPLLWIAGGTRECRTPRNRRAPCPEEERHRIFLSSHSQTQIVAAGRTVPRSRSGRSKLAPTLATGTERALMVTADIVSFGCERKA